RQRARPADPPPARAAPRHRVEPHPRPAGDVLGAGDDVGEAAGGEEPLDAPPHRSQRERTPRDHRQQRVELGGNLAATAELEAHRGHHRRTGRLELRPRRGRGQQRRHEQRYSTSHRSLRSTPRLPMGTSLYTLSHWIWAETRLSKRYSAWARVPLPETG